MASEENRTDAQLYVLFLRGGIEPDLWGPYSSKDERLEDARAFGSLDDSVVLLDAPGPIAVETLGSRDFE